jgi:hypothetical protein
MKKKDIKNILDDMSDQISNISDEKVKKILSTLFNLVELLSNENDILKEKVQKQKDEINRLKGEQGKPNIKANNKGGDEDDDNNGNHSSENDRKPKGKRTKKNKKSKKNNKIKIDRKIILDLEERSDLPDDLAFKGYEAITIQDLEIKTDNIKFLKKVYYSPSLKKTFVADLPGGYKGEFGPNLRTLILSLYNDSKVTQPNIKSFLKHFGIHIAPSTISRMITDNNDIFNQEKEDIISAGLNSTREQHIDDTSARVNGKNHYTHVLCNPFYTAYFTVPKKDRITVLEILCKGNLQFSFNDSSFGLMKSLGLPEKHLEQLKEIATEETVTKDVVDEILDKLFPSSKKKKQKKNRKIILESSAIVFYQSSPFAIEFLVCDDAPQFNLIATHKVLCWIHEGRHYKKLNPIVPAHRNILDDFITQLWGFYKKLLEYKENPNKKDAKKLEDEFDSLFSQETGYEQLDNRISKTYAKKKSLLLVLQFPFLPLHNNPAELGARVQARHRDINLHNKNEKGVKAKDTFATIVQTCKKLGVSFFEYIKDRITNKYELPSLANLIEQKSQLS